MNGRAQPGGSRRRKLADDGRIGIGIRAVDHRLDAGNLGVREKDVECARQDRTAADRDVLLRR
jgi:hypothetical protein